MTVRLVLFATLLVVFSYSPLMVDSQAWWSLGVTSCAAGGSSASCETCAKLESENILTTDQKEKCAEDSSPVQALARGTRRAIIECQRRFECDKWNCSTFKGDHLFGSFVVDYRVRETAVLYAFLGAGAVKDVADACRSQRIAACPCTGDIGTVQEDNNVIITSCSDNLEWAIDYVLNFLTPPKTNGTEDEDGVLCDVHNINVGIQAVNSREKYCTCHGLSGSCAAKTCYEKAPDVSEIGESLYSKYEGAIKVTLVNGTLERAIHIPKADPLGSGDLTYVDDSPDFCTADAAKGILGTSHRECDISRDSWKSCSLLCCERGYYTVTYTVPVEECVFEYCCRIKCTIVRNETITEHRCNP